MKIKYFLIVTDELFVGLSGFWFQSRTNLSASKLNQTKVQETNKPQNQPFNYLLNKHETKLENKIKAQDKFLDSLNDNSGFYWH